jgi:phage terminase large subunit
VTYSAAFDACRSCRCNPNISPWRKDSDIHRTVTRAFGIADEHGYQLVDFDSDGLGAGVRGDAENINQQREQAERPRIKFVPFRGSGAVQDPDDEVRAGSGRTNADYYANFKAQCWFALRSRSQATYRAVVEGLPYKADELISIAPGLPELSALLVELSQPTYSINTVGKALIDKKPEGTRSPNLAYPVMIAYNPGRRCIETWPKLV